MPWKTTGRDTPPERRRRGWRNLGPALAEERRTEIRRLYRRGLATIAQLARRFDLMRSTVRDIVRAK